MNTPRELTAIESSLAADVARLTAQRDVLLKTCDVAEAAIRAVGGSQKQSLLRETWEQLRAAIAKAKP